MFKKIKYFFIGLKFRYLVKLIAMNLCDTIYAEIKGKISTLDKNTLRQSNFISDLFNEFKIPPISIDKKSITFKVSNHSYTKNDLPQKYECHLENTGTIEVYTFEYEIKEGYFILTKLKPELKLINKDFDFIFTPNIVDNKVIFDYPNWCSKPETYITQKANDIFDNLDVLIQGIVSEINHTSNFKNKVNGYIKSRLIFLNKNN